MPHSVVRCTSCFQHPKKRFNETTIRELLQIAIPITVTNKKNDWLQVHEQSSTHLKMLGHFIDQNGIQFDDDFHNGIVTIINGHQSITEQYPEGSFWREQQLKASFTVM